MSNSRDKAIEKAEMLRREVKENLQKHIDEYLANGGDITEIEYGMITRDDNTHEILDFGIKNYE